MMRRQVIASLAGVVVSLLSLAHARSATLVFIPAPAGGPTPDSADAVSGDGTVAAGSLVVVPVERHHLYRWTRDGGTVDLGRPLGRDFNIVTDVSDDGGTIVGWAYNHPDSGGPVEPFRWTQAGGFSSLGTLPGYAYSTANGVSADGSVAVGSVLNEGPTSLPEVATRWTATTGTVALPLPAGQVRSAARDVSGDGAVAVGRSSGPSGIATATRWTAAGAEVLAGMPAGRSVALAASGDGTVVAGTVEGASPEEFELFRWTESGGLQRLGGPPGGPDSVSAVGISADGSVIAGYAIASGSTEGFLWDAAHGIRSLKDILTASGIDTGTTRFSIRGLSADGTTVVGYTNGGDRAFVAVIPEPTGPTAGAFLLALAASQRTCRGRAGCPAANADRR